MAIAFVQENANGSGSATSVAATFTTNQTAGNTNIVGVLTTNSTQPTVTDNAAPANTYTLAASANLSAQSQFIWLFAAPNITGGASIQVTATTTGAAGSMDIIITEFSGVGTTQDGTAQTNTAGSPGTAVSTPNLNTTNASDLIIGLACNGGAGGGFTAGTSYTLFQQGSFPNFGLEYQIVSATGAFNGAMTIGTSQWWTAITAAFKASGAAPLNPTGTGTMLVTGQVTIGIGPTGTGSLNLTGAAFPYTNAVAGTGTMSLTGVAFPMLVGGAPAQTPKNNPVLTYWPYL